MVKIKAGVWWEETLDEQVDICYTVAKEIEVENQTNEKNIFRCYNSRQKVSFVSAVLR